MANDFYTQDEFNKLCENIICENIIEEETLESIELKQAKNAIKWIDALISGGYKQGTGRLGDSEVGFCCLGVGCSVLKIPYDINNGSSHDLKVSVGLKGSSGEFFGEGLFYNKISLVGANDNAPAGLKRIGKFMKARPEIAFKPEVAILIKELYAAA